MTIHTIGDSHSVFGWSNTINHHLGPILCYSFGNEKLNRFNIQNINISDNDTIIFCMGEIDCRCHIKKHISENLTYQQIIDTIINNYIDAINVNVSLCKYKLKNVCIFNVVPPIEKHNTHENPDFPYLGSDEERQTFVNYFNNQLRIKCNDNGYIFFNVYDKYKDDNGFLRKDFSDGNVHIRDGKFIDEFIFENDI